MMLRRFLGEGKSGTFAISLCILAVTAVFTTMLVITPCFAIDNNMASSPKNVALGEFERLKESLRVAEEKLEQITQEAYEQNPVLKRCEDEYERLHKWYEQERTEPRLLVGRYLKEEEAKTKMAYRHYEILKGDWATLFLIEILSQDPEKEAMFKALATKDKGIMHDLVEEYEQHSGLALSKADFEDPDLFWKKYKTFMISLKPMYEEHLGKYQSESGFPSFVLDQARESSEAEVLIELIYGPHRRLITPKDLADAREEVTRISSKMTGIWPEWKELELKAQGRD